MLANGKLSKAIADMGFHEFRRQLEYKNQLYGSKWVIVDRFYPSSKICSICGERKSSLSLSQRAFQCDNCGFECNRDLNAAVNLSQEAARLVGESLWTGEAALSWGFPPCRSTECCFPQGATPELRRGECRHEQKESGRKSL